MNILTIKSIKDLRPGDQVVALDNEEEGELLVVVDAVRHSDDSLTIRYHAGIFEFDATYSHDDSKRQLVVLDKPLEVAG
jgi:hypothetical protein